MIKFRKKKIEAIETFGEKMKRHREQKKITLEKVAKQLQINTRYLRALENDNYHDLPAEIYTKNFIRRYANLLNINEALAIDLFNKEKLVFKNITPEKKTTASNNKESLVSKIIHFLLKPNTLKYSLIILIFVIIIFYITFSINRIFSPPELIIITPEKNNIITTESTIIIEGVTEKEVELTINSKQILYDQDGRFKEILDLHKDLNIIKIIARKKHSKPNTIYKQIIVEEKNIEN